MSLGIDPGRYWLLTDLLGQLSERGEMLDQLGTNGVALRTVTWFYAAFSAFLSVLLLVTRTPQDAYLSTFLVLTSFLLLSVLLSEAGNSLVNPAEGLVLAHQPINGATYTAAKLSHLARVIGFLVVGINTMPSLAGLGVRGARWTYPLIHLVTAFAVGLVAALLCCALYGWLVRLLPARRLKAAAQLAGTVPLLAMMWWQPLRGVLVRLKISDRLPEQPAAKWVLFLSIGVAAAAAIALGIRSLSADYLIRVSGMMHSGSSKVRRRRRSRIAGIAARLFGGQPARAGCVFVSRMMRRDFQFRRQAAPTLIAIALGLAPLIGQGWRIDPFSPRFTAMHLLPHLFGLMLFFTCNLLPYGGDFKAAWIFLLAPARVFGGFAGGIYAALFLPVIVLPHLVLFPVFAWLWGIWHSGLFFAYSLAAASVYLALELWLIDGVPFTRQVDPARGAASLPLMILGGLVMGIAVGIQYFVLFRSPATVVAATGAAASAAYLLTRRSLESLEVSMRNGLALLSGESGTLYREVDI